MKKVTISTLRAQHDPATISIRSLEGDIYISYATHEGQPCIITDRSGQPLKARSLCHMHELLHGVPCKQAELVVDSPYDEMIGLGQAELHRDEMPLAWQ